MGLSRLYARFRGSAWFLAVLAGWIASWVTLHLTLHFDPSWGLLNLLLSIEASLSVAILIMAGERDAVEADKHKRYLLHLLEAQVASMEALKAAIEEINRRLPAASPLP